MKSANRVWLSLCLTMVSGCGASQSPQQRELAALAQSATVDAKLDQDGRVVELTFTKVSAEAALPLAKFSGLKSLTAAGTRFSDSMIRSLGEMPTLNTLILDGTEVTDAGVAALSNLTQLRHLDLAGCKLTDEGLAALAGLTELRYLNLNRTQIHGSGLKHLNSLSQLESLHLQETPLELEQCEPWTGLTNLKTLHLAQSNVDGSVGRLIQGLSGLERLYLDGTKVADDDVAQLTATLTAHTPRLRGLFLDRTGLSDASLETLGALAQLPDLALIHLHRTDLSLEGYVKLRQALPQVNLVSEF